MGFIERYISIIDRFKIFIIAFWVIIVGLSMYFAPKFISSTTNTFSPPDGSLAYFANDAFAKYFPNLKVETDLVVFVASRNNQSVLGPDLKQFTFALNDSAYRYITPPIIVEYEGYYTILAKNLPIQVAQAFVSPDNQTTIITVSADINFATKEAVDFASYLRDQINSLSHLVPRLQIELTGVSAFIPVMQESVERDLGIMDAIVMPIALAILAYMLKSFRLMLVPFASVATSGFSSFAFMYFVSLKMDITSFTPSLMMSSLIALAIDYSLFLLTRYREELYFENNPYDSVVSMIGTAGHTILISGLTLGGCFIGLIIFPGIMLKSSGIGCASAIFCTLIVNLTQTPAILLLFPNFFSGCVKPFNFCGFTVKFGTRKTEERKESELIINTESEPLIRKIPHNDLQMIHSFWYKLGKFIMKFPYNILILIVVIGLTIPCDLHSIGYKTTDSMLAYLPRGSPTSDSYALMLDKFGPGALFPYRLLIVPPNGTVINQNFFSIAQSAISELTKLPNTSPQDFNGLLYSNGLEVPYFLVSHCLETNDTNQICNAIRFAYQNFVNKDQTATWMFIKLDFDPLASEGDTWLQSMRHELDVQSKRTGLNFYLAGLPADSLDTIDSTYAYFIWMLSITCGLVLIFVAIAFRSIIVPLRSILTITLTICFVYGFATLTYQDGALNWIGLAGIQGIGALAWIVPIISYSLIVGIGLDYDIFLLIRVKEYRTMGYSSSDSVVLGLYKTGHIITAAGIIMSIAFSGLLFSNMPALNQLAFYLVCAVLFDTFIVRSILVPALMSLLKDWNWFPSKLPPVIHNLIPY